MMRNRLAMSSGVAARTVGNGIDPNAGGAQSMLMNASRSGQ
jgi:hypothetical protein